MALRKHASDGDGDGDDTSSTNIEPRKRPRIAAPSSIKEDEEHVDVEGVDVQDALEQADAVQRQLDVMDDQCAEEILEIERRYQSMRKPILTRRSVLLSSVPELWITAMLNHETLCSYITDVDSTALAFLTSLDVELRDDIKSGYTLIFTFDDASNPCFSDCRLKKEVFILPDGDIRTSASSIKGWKEGWNLDAMQGRIDGSDEYGDDDQKHPSFFSLFSRFPGEDGDNYNESSGDGGEGDATGLAICELIKEEIYPFALSYFNSSEAVVMDDNDDDGDGDDICVDHKAAAGTDDHEVLVHSDAGNDGIDDVEAF